MKRAMILAAGLGTRLRPLTEELPKPLVWLGDRPVLAHIARELASGGIEAAVVNTHHLAETFTESQLAAMSIPITVLHEREILGTAGGVSNAAEALGSGDVVVWNGDIVMAIDVRFLIEAHRVSGLPATLAVCPRPVGQGTIGLDAEARVVRLRGERFGDEVRGGDFVGVQAIGAGLRSELPARGCLVGDGYLPLLRAGGRLGAVAVIGPWDDIGTVGAYLAANARWLAGEHRSAFVSPSASVAAGVNVVGSVIGDGAVVEGDGTLRGCVVWPGARASAPLEAAVVTASGRVARA